MSLFSTLFTDTVTVASHERAVVYVDGAFTRVLEPGRHRVPARAVLVPTDARTRLDTIGTQEVLTADGVAVRVTAAVRWRVADPRAYVETSSDPFAEVYLAVQLALRDALVAVELDALVSDARRLAGAALLDAARAAGAGVGIAVEAAAVKDVVLPHELRMAFAERATARTRGQARLEAARAETAALRSLANGAKLLEDHPALARQRLVEALPPGATLELGL
ncbi:slipin family protein [Nocardioides flavescens]|uniref:Slipin family protein n=1 Tax=Nocardioides flavescens TaxID=2691959 RepID=A0A6L7EWJ9_9ACTN|nr:slipin family protein [Nocardioides flavescens]MXG88389.1 slipin family protein [Nocardioides flavescens]